MNLERKRGEQSEKGVLPERLVRFDSNEVADVTSPLLEKAVYSFSKENLGQVESEIDELTELLDQLADEAAVKAGGKKKKKKSRVEGIVERHGGGTDTDGGGGGGQVRRETSTEYAYRQGKLLMKKRK